MPSPSPSDRMLLPIACTLEPDEGRARRAAWQALHREHPPRVERTTDALVVRYPYTADAHRRLTELVDGERECCSFATWTLDVVDDGLRLVVAGPADALDALLFVAPPAAV